MGWPELLVMVRHAESEGNVLNVDERAQYDMASHRYKLTELGRKQAQITGEYLRKEYGTFDTYYVSYYQRSKETMEIMCPETKVYEDPRLAEAQRGIWHTLTWDEIARQFPNELKRKDREGLYHYRPWGGENWPDIELRTHSFLGTLARDQEKKKVLMVVHGHWQILFQRLIEHFSIDEAVQRYKDGPSKNASVTVYKNLFGGLEYGVKRETLEMMKYVVPWEGRML